ncbi:hypothetical protein LXA43DRAFT_283024 [Ganoderma leucocontextum]|nr:hypothetical protein LXA43DRAFT_283024 [Ganoderma leucocontextum]
MPREVAHHTLERTALWIQAQDSLKVQHPLFSSASSSPARSSTKTSSTYRSTTSSEATSLKPSLGKATSMQRSSHRPPPSTRAPSTHTRAPSTSTQRPLHDSRTQRSMLPFPVSPAGSGYPVAMEVAAPRRPIAEGEDKKMLRLPVRKDRRPSLLDQIKQLGTPGHRRRDSEPGKKA